MENYSIKTDAHPAEGAVTFLLNGQLSKEALEELRHSVEAAREQHQEVVIDLSEVTLVDRKAAEYLSRGNSGGVRVINCPVYLSRWIQGGAR